MGLLDKAATKHSFELDEAGQSVLERIKHLSPSRSMPFTSLSLLKTIADFQVGICLSLKQDHYVSYASVGVGLQKIIVLLDDIKQHFGSHAALPHMIELSGQPGSFYVFPP
ncbi:hypothetical protein FACS1894200_11510 [Spirochaetia bacterium]|nr:hypothetical protein FACS1894200_11510 [Spirochaetia bacterium]